MRRLLDLIDRAISTESPSDPACYPSPPAPGDGCYPSRPPAGDGCYPSRSPRQKAR
jgi:hypothetical protein